LDRTFASASSGRQLQTPDEGISGAVSSAEIDAGRTIPVAIATARFRLEHRSGRWTARHQSVMLSVLILEEAEVMSFIKQNLCRTV
jgi:hypothetical protein